MNFYKSVFSYFADYYLMTSYMPAHYRVDSIGRGSPSVKTFHSPLSAEFWRYFVLGNRTQRRVLLGRQSEETEI